LLTIILDTNPAAWSLLHRTISLSKAVSNLLVLINAHLACNYTNRIAVIASHCDVAQWLYPTSVESLVQKSSRAKRKPNDNSTAFSDHLSEPTKRLKINNAQDRTTNGTELGSDVDKADAVANSDKYRPFRLVEEELLRNLSILLSATDTTVISSTTSTMVAGALTLALSYINRQKIAFAEANGGAANNAGYTAPNAPSHAADSNSSSVLHSRILLISVSPSHDLAHQYIPIMNSIFACQRLLIPIDICQMPTPNAPSSSTVFLQQASDATKGVYIPLSNATSAGLLQYLMMAFLPTQSSRLHLVLPTRIDVDFRAACFCHRRVVDIGFVCSICLSIFCSVPENGDCLTCGTHLELGDYGGRPMVVPRQKKKKKNRSTVDGSQLSASTPGAS
jgi:transcription initiation factor TFIIH subunit 3